MIDSLVDLESKVVSEDCTISRNLLDVEALKLRSFSLGNLLTPKT
jgi:hypothetical protein